MQQSTYVSLSTQAIRFKLNSASLKDKIDKLINDSKDVADNFKIQEHNIKQLGAHENKNSRDFYSLVNTAERNLGDLHRKNAELAKKLNNIETAAAKIDELKTKLLAKYDNAVNKIKLENQKPNLYDFVEYKAHLETLNENYNYTVENIAIVKESFKTNNSYYDRLQIMLSSFSIDKLKKDTIHNVEKLTKNVEALCSIYPNASIESKEEIARFLPQLKLNINNLNQKSEMLFAFGTIKDTSNLAKIATASNDEQDNSASPALKFG